MPLESALVPLEALEFEPMTDYVRSLFEEYQRIRGIVGAHMAKGSNARALAANRFRRPRTIAEGDRVVYRDPRARAAGGRAPWKKPLTEPLTVVSADGNKLVLQTPSGDRIENCHIGDCVLVPPTAKD